VAASKLAQAASTPAQAASTPAQAASTGPSRGSTGPAPSILARVESIQAAQVIQLVSAMAHWRIAIQISSHRQFERGM